MTNSRMYNGVICLCIIVMAYFGYMVIDLNKQLKAERSASKKELKEDVKEIQQYLMDINSGITLDQRRRFLINAFTEIIKKENPKLSPQDAYLIAETDVDMCERFKRIDIFLLFAIQKVESTFDKNANSNDGAIGLNQIIPSTARMLCRMNDWEYSPTVLRDVQKSTYLACTYLDMMYVEYDGNINQILADYNGGPNAGYWIDKDISKIQDRVKQYVLKVRGAMDEYSKISSKF